MRPSSPLFVMQKALQQLSQPAAISVFGCDDHSHDAEYNTRGQGEGEGIARSQGDHPNKDYA